MTIKQQIEQLYRTEAGKIQAFLLRFVPGDMQLVEDVFHDAVSKAITHWAKHGIPENPAGWLTVTAKNTLFNRLQRKKNLDKKLYLLESDEPFQDEKPDRIEIPDDRLRLIFICCHPALSQNAQIALTLRTVCGIDTEQIAQVFLEPLSTLRQRLVRAKRKIKQASIPYSIPRRCDLPERIGTVLSVIYLVFNLGYEAERNSREDIGLAGEAIKLAKLVNALIPHNPEVMGLLSLMLFNLSRRNARIDSQGKLVTLEHQDRKLWDHPLILEAADGLTQALALNSIGEYQIQAAIGLEHAMAKTAKDTDWHKISALYELLLRINNSPVIALNHAVAVGMAKGPDAGLKALEKLEKNPKLQNYHLLYGAIADFHRRKKRGGIALNYYKEAMLRTTQCVEIDYYRSRILSLTDGVNHLIN